jgi:hypothetical protein
MKMILPQKIGSLALRGGGMPGFQWHDICSIVARQSIFKTQTAQAT